MSPERVPQRDNREGILIFTDGLPGLDRFLKRRQNTIEDLVHRFAFGTIARSLTFQLRTLIGDKTEDIEDEYLEKASIEFKKEVLKLMERPPKHVPQDQQAKYVRWVGATAIWFLHCQLSIHRHRHEIGPVNTGFRIAAAREMVKICADKTRELPHEEIDIIYQHALEMLVWNPKAFLEDRDLRKQLSGFVNNPPRQID